MDYDDLIGRLRQRFYYLNEQGQQRYYWDSETGEKLQTMHLFTHCYKWLEEAQQEEDTDGLTSDALAANWQQFQKRLKDEFFTPIVLNPKYRPEQPQVVNVAGNWHPNSWRPPEVTVPDQELCVKPFLEHLERMLGGQKKVDYLLDQLAYRYQHPDHLKDPKPHIAFFFYGKPGMGKGTFSKIISKVFGESAVKIAPDQKELQGGSSVDLWKRTWLFVEEVDVKQGSTDYNKIKTFVGATVADAARKNEHVSKHELPAQLIMFSNSAPTFIETNDRRFFISKWEADFEDLKAKEHYFRSYHQWLDSEEAYAAIAYLLKHRDVSKFSLAAEAMMTDEKRAISTLVRDTVVDTIAAELEDNPAICFIPSDFQDVWNSNGIKSSQIKHKLSEAGLSMNSSKRYANNTNKNHTRTLEIWTRPDWTLNRKQGQTATLVHNDGHKMPLADDVGYRGFWNQQAEF